MSCAALLVEVDLTSSSEVVQRIRRGFPLPDWWLAGQEETGKADPIERLREVSDILATA
jgi:hypothetical protein